MCTASFSARCLITAQLCFLSRVCCAHVGADTAATGCGPGLRSAGQAADAQQDIPPSSTGPPTGAGGTLTGTVLGMVPRAEAREGPGLLQERSAADGLAAARAATAAQAAARSVKGAADARDSDRRTTGAAEGRAAKPPAGSDGDLGGAAGSPEPVILEGADGASLTLEKDLLGADSSAPAKAMEGILAGARLPSEGGVEDAREEERHNLALAKDGAKVVRFLWTVNLNIKVIFISLHVCSVLLVSRFSISLVGRFLSVSGQRCCGKRS